EGAAAIMVMVTGGPGGGGPSPSNESVSLAGPAATGTVTDRSPWLNPWCVALSWYVPGFSLRNVHRPCPSAVSGADPAALMVTSAPGSGLAGEAERFSTSTGRSWLN